MTDFGSPVSKWQPDDECEMVLTVRNTFLDVGPVPPPCARPARRRKTWPVDAGARPAPEGLRAAAFACDSPRSGAEGCADGREDDELGAPMRAAGSLVSTQSSCETVDVISDCPAGEEGKKAPEKKGVDKSRGLKTAKGNRPGKKARDFYRNLAVHLEGMVRQDPLLSLEDIQLPQRIQDNEELKAKLFARVEAARPAVPMPSARPARRCSTAPEALLAAAHEPNHLCARGDGDSNQAPSLQEEEPLDGGTPRSGNPERQGHSDDGVVPDDIEMRVTIRSTFIHVGPVASELWLRTRTARRHKTAPEILLATAFARDSPRSGTEGCADGREDDEACQE